MNATLPSGIAHAEPPPARHAAHRLKAVSTDGSADFDSQLKNGELPSAAEPDTAKQDVAAADEKLTPAIDGAATGLPATTLFEARIAAIITAPAATSEQATDDVKGPETCSSKKPLAHRADVKGTELAPDARNGTDTGKPSTSAGIVTPLHSEPQDSGEKSPRDAGSQAVQAQNEEVQLQPAQVPVVPKLPEAVSTSSPGSPARQVVDHLLRSLGIAPEKSPIRSLRLSLSPRGLGDVDLTMRMRGKELAVRIEAETAAAVAAIGDHRDILNSALREHGLALPKDGVTVVLRDGAVEDSGPRGDHPRSGGELSGGGASPDRQADKPNHNLQDKHDKRHNEGVDVSRPDVAGRVV